MENEMCLMRLAFLLKNNWELAEVFQQHGS